MKNPWILVDYLVHRVSSLYRRGSGQLPEDFRLYILNDIVNEADFDKIENRRMLLENDATKLMAADFGAGSKSRKANRTIGDITRMTAVNPHFGRLLYRMTHFYKPSMIIELGTATGISTFYLAAGNPGAELITVEGNSQLAALASRNFRRSKFKNITVINSSFDDVLQQLVNYMGRETFVFIDGNHTADATLRYFNAFAGSGKNPVLVFDDINWSSEMRSAWRQIRSQVKSGIIIDLFYMGIYFDRPDLPFQLIRINY
jgi:predicted O-methyltransferase YrrM